MADKATLSVRQSVKMIDRRKFLSAVGTASTAGIAGCNAFGGSGGSNNSEEINYWTLFGGGDGDAMEEMVNAINEDTDDLTINRQRQTTDEYYDVLFTGVTGSDMPDLAVVHASRLASYQDYAINLGERLDTDPWEDTIAESGMVEGELVGAPIGSNPYGLWYNKDIFEEAGLDPEDPPNTPERFVECCEAITENTDHISGVWNEGRHIVQFLLNAFAAQMNISVLEQENDTWEPGFDNEEGLHIMEQFDRWVSELGFADDRDVGWDSWNNGTTGMLFEGTWHYGTIVDLDFDWGVTQPFVMPELETQAGGADDHTIIVTDDPNRSEEQTEKAIEAARLLTQDPEYNTIWGVEAGHIPASTEANQSDELRNSDTWEQSLSTFYEMVNEYTISSNPKAPNTAQYVSEIYGPITDIQNQNIDPEEALETAAEGVRNTFE